MADESHGAATSRPTGDWARRLRLPGYEDLVPVGPGVLGWVFKARQTNLKRVVTLKVLDPELAGDEAHVARFHREARAAARLRHPNIVALYDVGTCPDTGLHYIVLEHVEGRTVKELLEDEGPLSEADALEITRGVAAALACAEEHRIVHRDIKPDNILLSDDGVPKLVDLGLARPLGDAGISTSGASVGDPVYVAPEHGLGIRDVDTRADLYGLGVTLYHLLTGVYPFDAGSFAELVERHAHEEVPDPAERARGVSAPTSRLVAGLCARDRGDRYQTAEAALLDLGRALAGDAPLGPQGADAALTEPRGSPRGDGGGRGGAEPPREPRGSSAPEPGPRPHPAPGAPERGASPPRPFEVAVELEGACLSRSRFERGPVVVGRSPTCDVQIDNPIVSRRHVEVRRDDDGFTVVPLSSTNSTAVHGRRIGGPTEVAAGDRLVLSDKFRVVLTDAGGLEPDHDDDAPDDATAVLGPRRRAPAQTPVVQGRHVRGSHLEPGEDEGAGNEDPTPVPDEPSAPVGRAGDPGPPATDREPATEPSAAAGLRRAAHQEPETPAVSEERPAASAPAGADAEGSPPAPQPPTQRWPTPEEATDSERWPTPEEATDSERWRAPDGYLLFERGGQEVRAFVATGFQIGRSPVCDLRLKNPAPRKAALVCRCEDGYRLYNVGPDAEAVTLNDEPVLDQVVLQDGDHLEVCDVALRFAQDAP